MLSMVSPLFFCPSKWVLCASKRRMHQSSLTFQTTSRTDTTGPWSKVAVKLVSFFTRRSLYRTSPALWTHNIFVGDSCSTQFASAHITLHTQAWTKAIASVSGRISSRPQRTVCQFGLIANVWHPHFSLDRMRSRDNAIFPYIQQLLDMGLSIRNPRSRATHIAGAALDLVFVSSKSESSQFIVHQGDACCANSPVCCPSLTSDHFLRRRHCGLHWFQQCETIHQDQVLVASPPTRPGSIGGMG